MVAAEGGPETLVDVEGELDPLVADQEQALAVIAQSGEREVGHRWAFFLVVCGSFSGGPSLRQQQAAPAPPRTARPGNLRACHRWKPSPSWSSSTSPASSSSRSPAHWSRSARSSTSSASWCWPVRPASAAGSCATS